VARRYVRSRNLENEEAKARYGAVENTIKCVLRFLITPSPDAEAKRGRGRQGAAGQSRPSLAMAKSTKRIVFGSAERLSDNLTEVFRDFPQF